MAHWKLMVPDNTNVAMEGDTQHAPTVPAGEDLDAGPQNKK